MLKFTFFPNFPFSLCYTKKGISLTILIIVSVLVFANTLRNPFMWDDAGLVDMISEQKYQKHLKNPLFFLTPSYWKDYSTFHDVDAYVPVAPMRTLSLAIDYKIWQRNPFGYHLTNLILHVVNVILVYFLVIFLFPALSPLTALLTGLLFATHPMHTESVAWMKNRIDLLTSGFFLSSLILFVKHIEQTQKVILRTKSEESQKRDASLSFSMTSSYFLLLASCFCFILALLSKEIAVTLPAILVLYIICFVPKNDWKKKIILTLPFWLLTFLYIYFSQYVLKSGMKLPLMAKIDPYSNILLVFKTLAYYIKLLLLPFSFNADRVITMPKLLFEPGSFFSLITVSGIIFAAVKVFKYSKELAFCIFWFFITISPVSNIIYLAPRPIAEQRLYIPSIGFCILLGWLFANLSFVVRPFKVAPTGLLSVALARINPRTTFVIFFLLIFSYSVAAIKRNSDWRNEIVFWRKTAEKSPYSPRAKTNLAEAYIKINDYVTARQLFEDVLKDYPDYPPAHIGLGMIYFKSGDAENAVRHFQKAGAVE